MKKTLTIMLTGAFALASTNCTTSYDAYGNPRQSVDPGTAAAGVAAAGVLGYALANKRSDRKRYDNRYHGHSHHNSYRRPYRRY